MANYNQSVLTTAGLALANRAAKGLAKFKITRVTSTADVVGSSDIPELAKLPSEVQVGSITGQQPLADGDETVTGTKVLFTNHNLQTSYKINAVGLYATEDGKTEILYSVITAIEPEFMPDYGDQVLMEFGMTIYVVVGQVDNMSIIVNPDSFATVAYVDKAIDDHQVVFPETLTYSNRNEVITSKWTFAGGATDGKGSAYATTKDVATGLKNGLITKVTDNKNGSIQVNGNTFTPADDSKVLHSTIVQLSGTDLNTMSTAGFFNITNGLNTAPNSDNWTIYQIIPLSKYNGVQIAYNTNNNMLAKRTWYKTVGVVFSSWVSFADDSKVVHDNGNGTITVNGQTYTPANDVYAIKRNDAGNTVGTVKIPDGNLQSSAGDRFYPIKWFNSYDEAMTYSKAHPYVDCRW
ncbi:pyocin knob domain-containing protein [Levilactobacillus namurensis]|uniref:Pyocin knob domain-containing protein n=1 Tax=Levilactobacillus namurensis TaxID=380393 RepID=A0AAW8WAH7_9LACO|nr:pyocin knob domain-containing protein [Levilactobacillus namurensis]MDT7015132.1 pyocin knob domain-containing protein [Levilactobacillus namurensis]MDT7015311.1 pyocin knob domain-containing protein [Levilactobacillus namurensis]MDT7015561.1 pyocin knob domain-containing protein [Levilactobacillus namurensis]